MKMIKDLRKRSRGKQIFTLIELLIVVAIIAILAGFLLFDEQLGKIPERNTVRLENQNPDRRSPYSADVDRSRKIFPVQSQSLYEESAQG